MTQWIRYAQGGSVGFGTRDGERIKVHSGDMFNRDLRWAARGRNA